MARILGGKVVVITGAGGGIGREVSLHMADQGASIVVNDIARAVDGSGRSSPVADGLVAEIRKRGGIGAANSASVADPEGAASIVQTAIDQFGRLDVLVNLAGTVGLSPIWATTDEQWDRVVKTHLYGHFYCTRAAVRCMREAIQAGRQSSGRIINITSESGIIGSPYAAYSAAKMGVVGLTYSVAQTCKSSGITCNAIAPRADTGMGIGRSEERLRQLLKERGYRGWDSPDFEVVRRAFFGGPPPAVAPFAIWLASDEAQHVSGRVFFVSSGKLSVYSNMEQIRSAFKDGPFEPEEIRSIMMPTLPPSATTRT